MHIGIGAERRAVGQFGANVSEFFLPRVERVALSIQPFDE
ncbi:Uncharacterised protein [Burkholderia pseudomallei]|nr:Uncharacterised protein [Burkholderia pseudomallei]CAJ3373967.1 Uncharacterised protein [Burkholderia pseudomallei]CAJ8956104.1 Uncharacterised protein [Burkholderia pseudomallei]